MNERIVIRLRADEDRVLTWLNEPIRLFLTKGKIGRTYERDSISTYHLYPLSYTQSSLATHVTQWSVNVRVTYFLGDDDEYETTREVLTLVIDSTHGWDFKNYGAGVDR